MRAGPGSDSDVVAPAEDLLLVEALRAGDEAAFASLVESHQGSLLRLAMLYVPGRAIAEEVVQDVWVGVLHGLSRFEGRSSLKTWIFRILVNRARTRGQREHRSVPFAGLFDPAREPAEPSVDGARFRGPDDRWPGHWASPPASWDVPEDRLMASETLHRIRGAIEDLPPSQREVITLRDVEGWSSREVCNALGITETNQRVLLHRARAKVRRALDLYLRDDEEA